MPSVKVGLRRLYLAKGVSLSNKEELNSTFKIQNFYLELYLGKNPKLNIHTKNAKVIPYDPNKNSPIDLSFEFQPAPKSKYAGEFFAELLCWTELDVSQEQLEGLNNSQTHCEIKEQLIKNAKNINQENYESFCNLLAGILGLKFHFQLFYELVNENYWIWTENTKTWNIEALNSPIIHLLESLQLNENGQNILNSLHFREDTSLESIAARSFSFSMLLHGWQEHDSAYKFINFFTALEIAIQSYAREKGNKHEKEISKKIKALIKGSNEEESVKQQLLQHLTSLSPERKPLTTLFRQLVEDAQFENHEHDLEAFLQFYKCRNQLIHQGNKIIKLTANLINGGSIQLESLTEKYVNWVYFRDANIYKTRYREQPKFITATT